MADDGALAIPDEALTEAPVPRRRRRSLSVDKEKVSRYVLDTVDKDRNERSGWMDLRLIRYAKLRGWRQDQALLYTDAHNEHIPMVQANNLRVQAGLFNAVMGNHPIMQGETLRKDKKDAAESAANLVEYQFMVESDGEQKVAEGVQRFVEDGTVMSYQPWVKEIRKYVDVRTISAPPEGTPLRHYMLEQLPTLIEGTREITDETSDGYHWTVKRPAPDRGGDQEFEVNVYYRDGDDDRLDVELRWDAVVFDGPQCIVHRLEDVVAPLRSQNLQPVTPYNPYGAPRVARLVRVSLDSIRRRMKDGTYDLLTEEEFGNLIGFAQARAAQDTRHDDNAITEKKEEQAGFDVDWSGLAEEHRWVTMIEWYGGWVVDPDGLEDEVIFWVTQDGGFLCRARFLTEQFPATPPHRPLASAAFIPVSDCLYGISLPELLEGLHDILHDLINSNLDRGDVATLPAMLYRPSSGIKNEVMRIRPGDWIPVDNPDTDVKAVQYPHSDQSWSFNMIGMMQQWTEKLIQVGPLQMGQVPQGKASALRTVGTTMAILQQGAALPEQILRRFFTWLQEVYGQYHVMNSRYLPKKKQYLIMGKPKDSQDAYAEIDRTDVDLPVTFNFQATLLNTNKGVVSQALQGLGAALFNPLSLQIGTVNAQTYYQWQRDLINAHQLDPDRYVVPPPGGGEPPISIETAITQLIEGILPSVNVLGGPEMALQELMKWAQTDAFGLLPPTNVGLFKHYVMLIQQAIQQAQQQQMMMQAAQEFQGRMGEGGKGPGAPPGMGEVPEMQTEAPTQAEIGGAERANA